jgi:hypothetical protein
MPSEAAKPRHKVIRSGGILFSFAYDEDDWTLLHIFARHRKEPRDAIWAWFNGQCEWNDEYRRYEGKAGAIGLYWFWIDPDASRVMVISCFDA